MLLVTSTLWTQQSWGEEGHLVFYFLRHGMQRAWVLCSAASVNLAVNTEQVKYQTLRRFEQVESIS